jgi:cyclophilin family peptidyl-prolyl cis-trans isomerase
MSVRLYLLAALILLAGCGSSHTAGSSPTVVPTPTATMKFKHPPAMTINPSHQYVATLATTDGTFKIELLPKVAPIAVNNFVFLARHHYYDNVIFHRILSTFMVQTGDETGTGFGDPGYHIKSEPVPSSLSYTVGTVAMANTGQPNTAGSQFFIVTGKDAKSLPHTYTIFGRVTSGMNVVRKIAQTPVEPSIGNPSEVSQPIEPPVITRVTIRESA